MPGLTRGRGNSINNSRNYTLKSGIGEGVWIKHPDRSKPYKKKWAFLRGDEEKYIISEREAIEFFEKLETGLP
jgi:hypothetical protein